MKYSVANIDCSHLADWQTDVLVQQLAELGFDSFEQDGSTLRAYIPTELMHSCDTFADELTAVLQDADTCLLSLGDCPDTNWNAAWEAEHEIEQLPLGVRITPHCAFGAGHHETTSMMIDELIQHTSDIKHHTPFRVFDHGTGTGVLAIFAAKLGADYVLADDIDDNSVRNARENAAANGVAIDVRLSAPEANLSPFIFHLSPFNLILANIHRNILLAQMSDYARCLAADGELWLSGFYESDIPALIAAATDCGLQHLSTRSNGEWRMLTFRKP